MGRTLQHYGQTWTSNCANTLAWSMLSYRTMAAVPFVDFPSLPYLLLQEPPSPNPVYRISKETVTCQAMRPARLAPLQLSARPGGPPRGLPVKSYY